MWKDYIIGGDDGATTTTMWEALQVYLQFYWPCNNQIWQDSRPGKKNFHENSRNILVYRTLQGIKQRDMFPLFNFDKCL